MIKLFWDKQQINYESIEWSGTDQQSSRQIVFSVPTNPYDTDFKNLSIKLGDVISLYSDANLLFLGTVTSRETTAQIGSATYTAKDFMHHLLRSTGSYKFTNTSPELITRKVCGDVEIPVGDLAVSKASISKMFFEDASLYDIIIKAYRSAKAVTGKNYMLVMDGKKVSVVEKGKSSGVKLTQGINITDASYRDTTDNMINQIKIFDDKLSSLGSVKDERLIEKYGIYQQTYTKEENVSAKSTAESMLVGVTKEATVDALGDIRAIAGKSIEIADKATKLVGIFYITSDTHTFESGTHTMSLGVRWDNVMEEGAELWSEKQVAEGKEKAEITMDAKAYWLKDATRYHSSKTCSAIRSKTEILESTVRDMKAIKITVGINKGKRKFTPCSLCWNTLTDYDPPEYNGANKNINTGNGLIGGDINEWV